MRSKDNMGILFRVWRSPCTDSCFEVREYQVVIFENPVDCSQFKIAGSFYEALTYFAIQHDVTHTG